MAEPIKIPWDETPEGYVDRLRDLVEREHVSSARKLVQEARQRYPRAPALARWHELLSPAKLLAPDLARDLGLAAGDPARMRTPLGIIEGFLVRVPLTLWADEGENLRIDGTFFVSDD
jgi:hypothetical protein